MAARVKKPYALCEVARIRCRLDPSWKGEAGKAECRALVLSDGLFQQYPKWVRRRLPVARINYDTAADTDPKTATYVERREQGSPFPPIVAVPSTKRPGTWWVPDGNHRVAAAKIRGDRYIDAFVPARTRTGAR